MLLATVSSPVFYALQIKTTLYLKATFSLSSLQEGNLTGLAGCFPARIEVHCVESVRRLLEHDNLGRERAAPHQPSPALRKWRELFRHFTAGVSLILRALHLLQDSTEYELKLKPVICAMTKIGVPSA